MTEEARKQRDVTTVRFERDVDIDSLECVAYKYGDIQYFRNEEKSTGYRVWSGRWKSCDCSCL